jgi:hypothetical protein
VLLIGAEGSAAVSLLGRKIIRRRVQHGAGKWLDSWFRPGAIEGIVRGAPRSPASRILASVDILAFAPGRDRGESATADPAWCGADIGRVTVASSA